MSKEKEPFDWSVFIPRIINPTKVLIIEALHCIGRPLSATDLEKVFGDEKLNLPRISYYMRTLAQDEVLTLVGQRQARGSMEKFYFFIPRHSRTHGAHDHV